MARERLDDKEDGMGTAAWLEGGRLPKNWPSPQWQSWKEEEKTSWQQGDCQELATWVIGHDGCHFLFLIEGHFVRTTGALVVIAV